MITLANTTTEIDVTACKFGQKFSKQNTAESLSIEHAFKQACSGQTIFENLLSFARSYEKSAYRGQLSGQSNLASLLTFKPFNVKLALDEFKTQHGLIGADLNLNGQDLFSTEFTYDQDTKNRPSILAQLTGRSNIDSARIEPFSVKVALDRFNPFHGRFATSLDLSDQGLFTNEFSYDYTSDERPNLRAQLSGQSSLSPELAYPPFDIRVALDKFDRQHGLVAADITIDGENLFTNELSYDYKQTEKPTIRAHLTGQANLTSVLGGLNLTTELAYPLFNAQLDLNLDEFNSKHGLVGAGFNLDGKDLFSSEFSYDRDPESAHYQTKFSVGDKLSQVCNFDLTNSTDVFENKLECQLTASEELAYGYKLKLANADEKRAGELNLIIPERTVRLEYSANTGDEERVYGSGSFFWDYANKPSEFIRLEAESVRDAASGKSSTIVRLVDTPNFKLVKLSLDKVSLFVRIIGIQIPGL